VPLGLQVKGGGKSAGIIISIVLILVYYIFVSTARSFGNGGVLDPALAAWLPNIIFAILGIILIFWAEKK
jgi:lipopolysaccharide export system permease protein